MDCSSPLQQLLLSVAAALSLSTVVEATSSISSHPPLKFNVLVLQSSFIHILHYTWWLQTLPTGFNPVDSNNPVTSTILKLVARTEEMSLYRLAVISATRYVRLLFFAVLSPYGSELNITHQEPVHMRNKLPHRTDSCRVPPRTKHLDRTSSYRERYSTSQNIVLHLLLEMTKSRNIAVTTTAGCPVAKVFQTLRFKSSIQVLK